MRYSSSLLGRIVLLWIMKKKFLLISLFENLFNKLTVPKVPKYNRDMGYFFPEIKERAFFAFPHFWTSFQKHLVTQPCVNPNFSLYDLQKLIFLFDLIFPPKIYLSVYTQSNCCKLLLLRLRPCVLFITKAF